MNLQKQDLIQDKFKKKLERHRLIQSEFEKWINVKENRDQVKQNLKSATLERWYDFIEINFVKTGKISKEIYENNQFTIFQWFRASINYFRINDYRSVWS